MKARRWWIRTLRVGTAGAVLAILAGAVLCENALHIPQQARILNGADTAETLARETRSTWQSVEIAAADGAILKAWFFSPPSPRGAVIVLHGIADTRRGVLGHARLLLENRYAVLTPDARGHGASGGAFISYGLLESDDVHRWTNWLCDTARPAALYGLGESMGAAILLQALAHETRFRAIVAESPFATFEDIAYYRMAQASGVPRGLARVAFWPVVTPALGYARCRYGLDLRRASPAAAIRATQVPILLIHGEEDTNVPPSHSQALQAIHPAEIRLWTAPATPHTAALSSHPGEFARLVLEWFASHR